MPRDSFISASNGIFAIFIASSLRFSLSGLWLLLFFGCPVHAVVFELPLTSQQQKSYCIVQTASVSIQLQMSLQFNGHLKGIESEIEAINGSPQGVRG